MRYVQDLTVGSPAAMAVATGLDLCGSRFSGDAALR